jgi:hypothetical protein
MLNKKLEFFILNANFLTNFMELSASWEAASCATTEELPSILRDWRFTTVFTTVLHWSLSWARSIQSILFSHKLIDMIMHAMFCTYYMLNSLLFHMLVFYLNINYHEQLVVPFYSKCACVYSLHGLFHWLYINCTYIYNDLNNPNGLLHITIQDWRE